MKGSGYGQRAAGPYGGKNSSESRVVYHITNLVMVSRSK